MLEWLNNIISEKEKTMFYGNVTLQFQDGVLVLVRVEETIKPPITRRRM